MKHKLYDNNRLLFDAKEVLDARHNKGKVLMKMIPADNARTTPASITTPDGVTFYKDHPYQYVTSEEADRLRQQRMPRFIPATKEELEDYYRE